MRLSSGNKTVSVVVPCLNEEEAIGDVVRELLSEGADEVVVVDNGSTDRTGAVARTYGASVVVEAVKGYGRACATGFAAIRQDADIVCFLDGDAGGCGMCAGGEGALCRVGEL